MEAKKAQWCQVNSDNDSYGMMSINQITYSVIFCRYVKYRIKREELVKHSIKYFPTGTLYLM